MIENSDLLLTAICDRRLISFSYENQPIRRAAPHAIYISTTGNKLLDAYQFEGYSKTGNLPDWRNFKLSKMENLVVLNEKFEIAPGYKPFSSKYSRNIHKI